MKKEKEHRLCIAYKRKLDLSGNKTNSGCCNTN